MTGLSDRTPNSCLQWVGIHKLVVLPSESLVELDQVGVVGRSIVDTLRIGIRNSFSLSSKF